MAIFPASGSLKCKLMAVTFKDVTLHKYTSLSRCSVIEYQDLTHKMVHHSSSSKYMMLSTTSLFNVLQDLSEVAARAFMT